MKVYGCQSVFYLRCPDAVMERYAVAKICVVEELSSTAGPKCISRKTQDFHSILLDCTDRSSHQLNRTSMRTLGVLTVSASGFVIFEITRQSHEKGSDFSHESFSMFRVRDLCRDCSPFITVVSSWNIDRVLVDVLLLSTNNIRLA